MNIKTFGIIVLTLIILGITMVYYIPLMPTMVDAWGTVNTSANVTEYTGVLEASRFMPIFWFFAPFLIVGIAIFVSIKHKGKG